MSDPLSIIIFAFPVFLGAVIVGYLLFVRKSSTGWLSSIAWATLGLAAYFALLILFSPVDYTLMGGLVYGAVAAAPSAILLWISLAALHLTRWMKDR